MKNEVSKNQVGLTFGVFSALMHAAWTILVGVGIGKPLIDWVLPLHFIDMAYSIVGFSLGTAILLVVLAFIGGYISGWILAAVWNWASKKVK